MHTGDVMRKVVAAVAGGVIALSLASCQWMTEMRLQDVDANASPAVTQMPVSQEPEATSQALPSGVVMPDESAEPVFSPSIEVPPPVD